MRKVAPWLMLAVFVTALVARMTLSMAQGDVYPEWSTLRADPMGAKVLFVALEGMPGLRVSRNFEPWGELAGARAQYVLLGVTPLVLKEGKPLEKLLAGGGEMLVGLPPVGAKSTYRTEPLGFLVDEAGLQLKDSAWRCVVGTEEGCTLAEKAFGKGRVRLLADATPLRNLDIHLARESELVAGLWRTDMPVIFDESHLGVEDSAGVGVLLRRYRLFPAAGVLVLVALLFVWRNSTSLLPAREPVTAAMTPQPAASLRTLLEQNVPRGRLLETLVAEWKRARHLLPGWQGARAVELDAALEAARGDKDLARGYDALQAAVRLRKGSA